MLHKQKINAFLELGLFLSQFNNKQNVRNQNVKHNKLFYDRFLNSIETSVLHNAWFTRENVIFCIENWANALTENNLKKWLSKYNFTEKEPKTVALIMAGNIPLVGFHDFMCVLLSENKVLVKLSSNDKLLLPIVAQYLIAINPDFENYIAFSEEKLNNFNAVIATGSNNTARYFEYYFGNKPNIIRKNRNSVAVLTGNESKEMLEKLADDIFIYFGLGCRNVSKLFVPTGYNFDLFFNAIFNYKHLLEYQKYANNYDYNKAVFLMSLFPILDNGFITLKEDSGYSSPIASVFYEYYNDSNEVKIRLENDKEHIQCIVSNNIIENSVAFGHTQKPNLWDYADNVDTMAFLLSI